MTTQSSISSPPHLTTRMALTTLRIYRAIVSPLIMGIYGPACRFKPSCSEYAQQAIATYGVMRGSAMAARRLARCHPLGGHGYDPVPARTQIGRE
jgi:putative membrane protein insertion efficiency factor